jgi:hypothetical protein
MQDNGPQPPVTLSSGAFDTEVPGIACNKLIDGFIEAKLANGSLSKSEYWRMADKTGIYFKQGNFNRLIANNKRCKELWPPKKRKSVFEPMTCNIVDTAPFIGEYTKTIEEHHWFSCGHSVHSLLHKPKEEVLCPKCKGCLLFMKKQINADDALRDELMKNNKATVKFEWPDPVEQSALYLWNPFKSNWKSKNKSKATNFWIDTLDNMFDFTCFLHGKTVLVSQLKIVSMEQDKKKQIKITGAYCPGTFNASSNPWNPEQILRCPEDGSIGLVDFGNGDYAGIGRLETCSTVTFQHLPVLTHYVWNKTISDFLDPNLLGWRGKKVNRFKLIQLEGITTSSLNQAS